jgi:hypothetical protein
VLRTLLRRAFGFFGLRAGAGSPSTPSSKEIEGLRFFLGFFFLGWSVRAIASSWEGLDGGDDPTPREPEFETGEGSRSILFIFF